MSFETYMLVCLLLTVPAYVTINWLLAPFYETSVKKVGGLTFVRFRRLSLSFSFSK